jgi:hypothetical protein
MARPDEVHFNYFPLYVMHGSLVRERRCLEILNTHPTLNLWSLAIHAVLMI